MRPGCGKTTLAQLLAMESKSRFRQLSAVTSGVQQLRQDCGSSIASQLILLLGEVIANHAGE